MHPIKVLLIEGTEQTRLFLADRLNADPQVTVVAGLEQAQGALAYLRDHPVDLVLMEVRSPAMDGFEATRSIMESHPLPVVLYGDVSTVDDYLVRSLQAGAVACIARPQVGFDPSRLEAATAHLLQTVKLMSEVKVVRRWSRAAPARREMHALAAPMVVGIGASTGGPPVLQRILAALPHDFPAPLLVVQHIAHGFMAGMADWLRKTSGPQILIGAQGMRAQAGSVYLAPDDANMGLGQDGTIHLAGQAAGNSACPSVAHLFQSLAQVQGARTIGVLLTGMGKDGARELKQLKDLGAVTIVQDSASSVIHGMPGEAIALGAATHIVAADRIANLLMTLTQPLQQPRKGVTP